MFDQGAEAHAAIPQHETRYSQHEDLRRRIVEHGTRTLSDAELLTVLCRVPRPGPDATIPFRTLLDRAGGLAGLGRMDLDELLAFPGIGPSSSVAITAVMELTRRRREDQPLERPVIASSAQAFNELHPLLMDLTMEEFWLLFLDRGNRVTSRLQLSKGGMHGTVADPKIIFKHALDRRASSLVLAHNHPSGQLRPSEEDIHLTRKLVEGARLLDIVIQDHLIITQHGYFSFADQGML